MEKYKIINNFNNYNISDNGNVWNVRKNRPMKPTMDSHGYLVVHLSHNGKSYNKKVHRLVAEAFIPNPLNLPCVNHINEDKTDNRAENLEWCDVAYNNSYGLRTHKTRKPILQFDLVGNLVREWESMISIERELGYRTGTICKCCKTGKQYGGFIWKYKSYTNP